MSFAASLPPSKIGASGARPLNPIAAFDGAYAHTYLFFLSPTAGQDSVSSPVHSTPLPESECPGAHVLGCLLR